MAAANSLHLATIIEKLTRHKLLMQGLLDLPPCLFDIRRCAMAEAVLGHVPKPVLLPAFPGVHAKEPVDEEEQQIVRALVRRVVQLQTKVESVRAALVVKVRVYKDALEEASVNMLPAEPNVAGVEEERL